MMVGPNNVQVPDNREVEIINKWKELDTVHVMMMIDGDHGKDHRDDGGDDGGDDDGDDGGDDDDEGELGAGAVGASEGEEARQDGVHRRQVEEGRYH